MDSIQQTVQTLGNIMSEIECHSKERENPKPDQPPDYTQVEAAIASMLQENTGCHILDSGGHYGRNWERARHVHDFRKTPRSSITVEDKEGHIWGTLNIFHFLIENLDLDEHCDGLQNWFNDFATKNNNPHWPGTIEEFCFPAVFIPILFHCPIE